MYEIANFVNRKAKYPTVVNLVDYPIHKGKPNPVHGKYYLSGSIPAACYDAEEKHSMCYDTEKEAINAAILAGAERIQDVNCNKVYGWE